LHVRTAGENLPITNFQGPDEEQQPEQASGGRKTLIRDCLLVAGLVIPLIVFFPWIAAYLPENVQSAISSATGGLLSGPTAPAAPWTHAAPAHVAPLVQLPTATVTKPVKLRATPAFKAAAVVTLQKDATVIVLEEQGNWTRVQVPAKDASGKTQQGWVLGSY